MKYVKAGRLGKKSGAGFYDYSNRWRMQMRNAVIVDSVRTAIGRLGGSLKDVQVDYLAAKVLDEIVKRTGIEKNEWMK